MLGLVSCSDILVINDFNNMRKWTLLLEDYAANINNIAHPTSRNTVLQDLMMDEQPTKALTLLRFVITSKKLAYPLNPNRQNVDGLSDLMIAIALHQNEIVRELIQAREQLQLDDPVILLQACVLQGVTSFLLALPFILKSQKALDAGIIHKITGTDEKKDD